MGGVGGEGERTGGSSDEGEKWVREKTRRRKSIGGRWKEKRGGRKGQGGRGKVTRWKGGGSRRVENGWVAASKGCQDGGTGGRRGTGAGRR